ncbi:Oxidoreductase [Maudiozyma exigua]|uniref:Mitochondrial intermembrane space import and assembly protein 40 n=1 Tax=Maudiozyma exigua TaxID=34358 RepID=A0A9P7BCY2_MAUEX|nr:Oxidoreductase [Kazachstania exigua]
MISDESGNENKNNSSSGTVATSSTTTFDEITIPGDITLFSPHIPKQNNRVNLAKRSISDDDSEDLGTSNINNVIEIMEEILPKVITPTRDFQMIDTEGVSLMIPIDKNINTNETDSGNINGTIHHEQIDWDSPSVMKVTNGNCGNEFKDAFQCFLKSKQIERGSDCIDTFNKIQNCLSKYKKDSRL